MLRIKRNWFQFRTPDAWKGAQEYVGSPKWDVNVVLVGNRAGYETLANLDEPQLKEDLGQALQTIMGKMPKDGEAGKYYLKSQYLQLQPDAAGIEVQLQVPSKFSKLPPESPGPVMQPGTNGADMTALFPPTPLMLDWRELTYTDGSAMPPPDKANGHASRQQHNPSQKAGRGQMGPKIVAAGIYRPGPTYSGTGHDAEAKQVLLDPKGVGPTNTINRAELAPIHHALQLPEMGAALASDSACSLYQIARYIRNPSRMQRHKHKPMLDAIAQTIRDQGRVVRLYKVKAHAGVVGNELADETAKAAAHALMPHKAEAASQAPALNTCDVSAVPPYAGKFWPMYTTNAAGGSSQGETDEQQQGAPERWHIEDLDKALQQHLHPLHKLGYSNTEGVYYQAWAATLPEADGKLSNAFLTDPATDKLAKTLTLMARVGQLNNGNFRHKAKMAPTPACVLCSHPMDGVAHSLSGCPNMMGMITMRHNEAGGMIYKAIKKGMLGASIVTQDIGSHNAAEDTDDTPARRTIPPWVTYNDPDTAKWRAFRPDIMMATELSQWPGRVINIIEIKYCQDTRREAQVQKANEQHMALHQALLDRGYKDENIIVRVITLGAMGTIYKDFHDTMAVLGVDKAATDKLAKKLSAHAVGYVKKIMCTKWQQERNKRGVG